MVCWWVWFDRNSVLFGKKVSRLDVVVDLALATLEEFQGVRAFEATPVACVVTAGRGFAGYGGVVRDGEGVVWATWALGGKGECVVEVAEFLACSGRPSIDDVISLLAAVSGVVRVILFCVMRMG
uniref:Uncharacterized protein n=1 Tax=Cannabis sativa TaxID=3483 RepID=A0A803NPM2_CANSA